MNILLTHSYFLHFDAKQLAQSTPYPPLATIQAASILRKGKYNVDLFDTNFVSDPKEIAPFLEQKQPDILVIYDDGFNYLTKMCLTNMREAAFKMIELAKAKNIHVIISSSDSTDHYENYLNKGADQVILGEADLTLLELAEAIKNNESFDSIHGIAFKNNTGVIKTPKRSIITQLDKLPLPAWDLVDISPYKKAWKKHGYFSINLSTTRGCPFKCNWCAKPIYGYQYNSRTPQHVISEIKLIQQHFSFDHIWFCDDIFGLNANWIEKFSNILKAENIKINYKVQSRADLLIKDDTVKYLAESGCNEVWMGAESGSQKILDAMNKGITIEQLKVSTQKLKNHGIKPCYFLQLGYLDENWEDIQSTLNLLFSEMPDEIGISVSYPLPGTPFHDLVSDQLTQKANWTESDELFLMYKSTYSPLFYKKLHRFIHKRFRQKQIENRKQVLRPKSFLRWSYYKMTSNLLYLQIALLKRTN